MASQLSRQLWLAINDLRRAYRQAMRFAVQTDPEGNEETSAAWKAVAHRRALLLETLAAAAPFLGPEPAPVKRRPRSATTGKRPARPAAPPARNPVPPRSPLSTHGSAGGRPSRPAALGTPRLPMDHSTKESGLPTSEPERQAEDGLSSIELTYLSAVHFPGQKSLPNLSLAPRRTLEITTYPLQRHLLERVLLPAPS